MKRIAITAALVSAIAAPAFAGSTEFAIRHFNESLDPGQQIEVLPADNTVSVSTRSGGLLANVFAHFNADQDASGDLRGLNGATVVSGTPAYGADIFAALKAESLEDE